MSLKAPAATKTTREASRKPVAAAEWYDSSELADGRIALSAGEGVTALFGIFDPKSSTLTYASAGYPAPFIVTPEGHTSRLPVGDSPPIWTFTLQPGSWIVVCNRADVAKLTLFVPPRALEGFESLFSAVPLAVPFVRRALEHYLIEHDVNEEKRFSAITAIGEALANAIEHAYPEMPGTVRLRVQLADAFLRINVEDSGDWRPVFKNEERGRGIPLMRSLMDTVEIQRNRSNTLVRMQLRIP